MKVRTVGGGGGEGSVLKGWGTDLISNDGDEASILL